ncbi:cell wall metabolism sensor histidine kinase WalK [Mycobacterium sp. PS03-16]|uniref:sensor histidine kinase n=1 Tax=Mycobacterium sp. PS03-16 TaxID=2559611 RepID=UPI001FD75309|nr:HAMP domain-containing sensor histidine kinase [Mycobacterium sp. PS03-16]
MTEIASVLTRGGGPAGQDGRHAAPPETVMTHPAPPAPPTTSRWRRLLPSTARTRIIGWMLLLVLAALGVVTFVTWRLLISSINTRMDEALRFEVEEFSELTEPGVNPRTGEPFAGVDEVIREAIAYNIARPNEKFLGYVDGEYRTQSRQEPGAQEVLARDPDFAAQVASVTAPASGRYQHPQVGEVRYLAIPVALDGDTARGVIVAAYLGDAEREEADTAARLMLIVGSVTTLGAAAAAWLIAGRILRPLRDVVETAHTITDTDLSMRIPSRGAADRDELDAVVSTLNGMLDRVESGVAAQRRFIDDAGHELRTPITIVRGHLEVVDAADPADVRSTVALVDDELERMNRMVSDLLLLAHSEQPTFLHTDLVDVAALTEEVFEKLTRLGDRHFVLETAAPVNAVLDPQRITQALVALADNACRFTEPGDRIGVGSQLSGGWLRFWVADSGPGVSDADRAHIFERFARGDQRGPSSDGAGLGLSIVRAIAVAHGGEVLLDSMPGRGATFTVLIPGHLEARWPES